MEMVKKYRYQLFILLVVGMLAIINYTPGTFLSGWDNLQSELSPWLAVKRSFFSVWQEYQSFGLLAGMAHGADFVRSIFVFLLSFIIPQTLIRYLIHFLLIAIAAIGMFQLLIFLGIKRSLALIGSLFYILNFATIEIVYLPFETFSFFLAFLPWQIWIFWKIITKNPAQKSDWLRLFLINLIATPQFVSQQLFIIYILVLLIIAIINYINARPASNLKKIMVALFTIFIINSFWILPQLYFLKTSGGWIEQAKMNQMATSEFYYKNLEKGNLTDFVLFNGFFIDSKDKSGGLLFKPWLDYRNNLIGKILSTIVLTLCGLGLIVRSKQRWTFIGLLIFIMSGLLINTFPFNLINHIFRANNFVSQVFRSPFTKFIIPYSLVVSYLFTVGLSTVVNKLKIIQTGLILLSLVLVIAYSFPSFRGYYYSPEMKIKIPQEYFELFDYFKSVDKNSRIALLPDYTYWGWFFHRWGYNGSGFLWYGIEQPIVSRTFDVWSDKSESYFWEIKSAAEAEDLNRFEKVLQKYSINYLLVDYSLLPVAATSKSLQYDRLENLLKQSNKIKLLKKGPILALYQVISEKPEKNFISLANNLPSIGPKVKLTSDDVAFNQNNNYQTNNSTSQPLYYPFLDLTTQTHHTDQKWQIEELENQFKLTAELNFDPKFYQLVIPTEKQIYIIPENGKEVRYQSNIKAYIKDSKLTVIVNKLLLKDFSGNQPSFGDCNQACNFALPSLDQSYGYLAAINSKNLSGQPLFFYIVDLTKKQSYTEDRLVKDFNVYLIAERYQHGVGYSFNFENQIKKGIFTKNQLNNLSVYLFPYTIIKNIYFINPSQPIITPTYSADFEVRKLNYYLYTMKLGENQKREDHTLILNQAYHPGWKAYYVERGTWNVKQFINTYFPFIFGKELKEHVLVNNWANGWQLNSETWNVERGTNRIAIIFWPQYLQFIGFGLMGSALIFILSLKHE